MSGKPMARSYGHGMELKAFNSTNHSLQNHCSTNQNASWILHDHGTIPHGTAQTILPTHNDSICTVLTMRSYMYPSISLINKYYYYYLNIIIDTYSANMNQSNSMVRVRYFLGVFNSTCYPSSLK